MNRKMPGAPIGRWLALVIVAACQTSAAPGSETLWVEAEHLRVIRGSCFPDLEQKTSGHWGLSGPGIAPEWTQGGESEWLSIACGPDEQQAAASIDVEVPAAGEWTLWVRYRDWRHETEQFAVRIEQAGQESRLFVFGERPVVDEDDELKLLWKWAFGWDSRSITLIKGPAKLTLRAHVEQSVHRQVDCLCLTTDRDYRPQHREKPRHATWKALGFDEFWMPGGGSTPRKPIQLSPKGRLVDEFLRLTRKHSDRGTPFTPIAFLLDRAHGWDPNGFRPAYFGFDESVNRGALALDRHARMLKEWFRVAYHPFGPREAAVNTGVTPTYLPGVFGNVFDVLVTAPHKLGALGEYPVVVLSGEVDVSAEVGQRLAAYIEAGGTLIASDDQLTGAGLPALKLPELGTAAEDDQVVWRPLRKSVSSQRYRYRAIRGGEVLATTSTGDAIVASFARGQGRLVFLSIPRGLGIDMSSTPLVVFVMAHARQGLLPIEVEGEVEWLLNRTDAGWLVALMNPAGNNRMQHGVGVSDYSQQRAITIRVPQGASRASEWFTENALEISGDGNERQAKIVVPAGGLRIVEIQ